MHKWHSFFWLSFQGLSGIESVLLVRLLERFGLLMGINQIANSESVFFQTINKTTLETLGYGWRSLDLYLPTKELANDYQGLVAGVRERLHNDLIGPAFWLLWSTQVDPFQAYGSQRFVWVQDLNIQSPLLCGLGYE